MRAVRVALLVGVRVVLAVGHPADHRPLDGHRAEDREGVLDRLETWNDRCVSRRWKPTVTPKPVTRYITARIARSVQETKLFQSRKMAAIVAAKDHDGREVCALLDCSHLPHDICHRARTRVWSLKARCKMLN